VGVTPGLFLHDDAAQVAIGLSKIVGTAPGFSFLLLVIPKLLARAVSAAK